jgi:thymidylate synthase
MNRLITICEDSFQTAWAKAIIALSDNYWKAWNFVVQIDCPDLFDEEINEMLIIFAKEHNLITPKHVAHTIFPQTFYKTDISRDKFYKKYWRFFEMSRKMPHSGWGTYFERMIKYSTPNKDIDQLGNIIDNINNRPTNYGASYNMITPYPHRDLNKMMGAPCLGYVTVQVEYANEGKDAKKINLLAVYRNHDFTKRTYGNYLGLCNLLKYIAYETDSLIGTLTCISSRADVPNHKSELKNIANIILGVET